MTFVAVQLLWLVGASFAGAVALRLLLPPLPGPALPFAVMALVLPGVVGMGIAVSRGAPQAAAWVMRLLAAWMGVALSAGAWQIARDGETQPVLGVAMLLLLVAWGLARSAAWHAQAAAFRALQRKG